MSDIKPWKTLSSEPVIEGEYFKIRKDVCQLPDGTIIQDYYVREQEDSVCVFCVTKERQVVLVKQYRHAIGQITVELPGGFSGRHDLNMGEAARRELLEESGYSSKELKEIGIFYLDPSSVTAKVHFFYAPDAEKITAPKYREREVTETLLCSLSELKSMIDKGEMSSIIHVGAIRQAFNVLSKELE